VIECLKLLCLNFELGEVGLDEDEVAKVSQSYPCRQLDNWMLQLLE
jgi:hypothetical protein